MVDQTNRVQRLVLSAALAAAVFVATIIIRIPIPATGGYLNFGDAIIVLSSLLFGPIVGAIAGGVGACAADIVGFPVFAIPTLVIKATMGLLIGIVGWRASLWRAIIAALLGEAWMVFGYFAVESWIFTASMGMTAALAEIYFNIIQASFGAAIGCTVYGTLRRQRSLS